jgi:hypothetical protein
MINFGHERGSEFLQSPKRRKHMKVEKKKKKS